MTLMDYITMYIITIFSICISGSIACYLDIIGKLKFKSNYWAIGALNVVVPLIYVAIHIAMNS